MGQDTKQKCTVSQSPDGGGVAELTLLELDAVRLMVVAMPQAMDLPELTAAEQEVVQLACEGCSNHEIARRRGASVKTVANQLRGVYEKLGINSRFELAALVGR